jgi:hypothetical protein
MSPARSTVRYRRRVAARLPDALLARLAAAAERHQLRLSEIVRAAIAAELARLDRDREERGR